jgi:hypothetical protein
MNDTTFLIGSVVASAGAFAFIYRSVNGKLNTIHTLVNSNMTASMQAELDATKRELAMMHEVIDLKKRAGHDPTPGALEAITFTEGQIADLRARLDDRLKAPA